MGAAGIDKHLGHGLVIVNLQETQYDSLAALRIYAKTDVVLEMLMEELGLKAELNSARKEIYHLPSWCKKEEEDVFQVPFDPTTGLLSSNKLTGPEKSMRETRGLLSQRARRDITKCASQSRFTRFLM